MRVESIKVMLRAEELMREMEEARSKETLDFVMSEWSPLELVECPFLRK